MYSWADVMDFMAERCPRCQRLLNNSPECIDRCAHTPQGEPVERPKVGDLVHYMSHGTPPRADSTQAHRSGLCRAAIITEVPKYQEDGTLNGLREHEWTASLAVLNPSGMYFDQNIPQAMAHGGWHQPFDGCDEW